MMRPLSCLAFAVSTFTCAAFAMGCTAATEDNATDIEESTSPQTREHILLARQVGLSARLANVAHYYGDDAGRIPVRLESGGVLYLSTAESERAPFAVYDAGDRVADGAAIASCTIDAAGGTSGCDSAYGEGVLFGLEHLQASQPDPSAMEVSCHEHGNNLTAGCTITWSDGSRSCFIQIGGKWYKDDDCDTV